MNEHLPHDISINVLGTSFSISAPEAPEYLASVLAQYEDAVAYTQGISEIKDPLRVAVLTGFLICDQYNKLKQQTQEDQAHTAEHMSNIISRLDIAIKEAG